MDIVFLVSRILFALVFIPPGLQVHLIDRAEGIRLAAMKGAPFPNISVPVAGVAIVVGGLSVALGIWADIGALLLCAYLLVVTPIMHPFWKVSDPSERQLEIRSFTTNMGLFAGGLILFYAVNQLQGSAGLMITDPLINPL